MIEKEKESEEEKRISAETKLRLGSSNPPPSSRIKRSCLIQKIQNGDEEKEGNVYPAIKS